MNKFRLLITTMVICALTACSSDKADPASGNAIELRLASAIGGAATRAEYPTTQSTAMAANETVYAWVYDAGNPLPGVGTESTTELMKAWTLTCNATGTLAGANKCYFPSSGNTVNAYAIHGNFTTTPVEGTTTWADIQTITHEVKADQSIAGNYELSDLLFARNTTITRDNSVKPLTFKHQLAKIEIHLVCGDGLEAADLTGATVKIKNLKTTATITLSKTADFGTVAVSGATTDVQCRMQYRDDVDRDVATPPAASDIRKAYAFAEAIVVPQWFSSDGTATGAAQTFLEITLPSNIVLTNTLGPIEFQQGKKLGYNVTLSATGIKLSTQITDWEDGVANPIITQTD